MGARKNKETNRWSKVDTPYKVIIECISGGGAMQLLEWLLEMKCQYIDSSDVPAVLQMA